MSTLIQAEKLMQIALVLPCAAFVGWLLGLLLDRHFHTPWIAAVGVAFGGASGLVYVIRLAMAANNDPALQDENSDNRGNDRID